MVSFLTLLLDYVLLEVVTCECFSAHVLRKHCVEFSSKTLRVGFGITIVQPRKKNIPTCGTDARNIAIAIRSTEASLAQNELWTHHQSVVRLRHEATLLFVRCRGNAPAC